MTDERASTPGGSGASQAPEIRALLTALKSTDAAVADRAREQLVALGASAVPALSAALHSTDLEARQEAALALAEIGSPAAAATLVAALTDEDAGLRWTAAEGLIRLGRAGLDILLHALLTQSQSVHLREGVHHVLSVIAQGDLASPLGPILRALDEPEPEIGALVPTERALEQLGLVHRG